MINKKIIAVLMLIVIFCGALVNVYGNDSIGKYYHDFSDKPQEGFSNIFKLRDYAEEKGCDNYSDVQKYESDGNPKVGYLDITCNGHKGYNQGYLDIEDDSKATDALKPSVDKVAGTVILILQILTVSGIIITGIRYMFAGADAQAEIKKTLPYLIIGIIIIFAGPTVIKFITDIFSEIAS